MSLYFTEEQDMLRQQIRRFIEERIMPQAEAWEEEGMVPREVLQEMGELGFFGIRSEAKYGGSEMDVRGSVIFAEELGRSSYGGFAVTALVHTDMAMPHLLNAGSEAQKDQYMPDLVAGKKISAIAVTEPDAGSDVAGMRTTATQEGDEFVLNGTKMFITNGVHADLYFVAAKTDKNVKGSRGITIFAIEKGTPGFTVGRALKKQGWLSSDTAELVFDNCRVHKSQILGEENKGFYAIMKNFQNERVILGAQAMGEAQKAIELAVEYVKQRKAFGGSLWDQQVIRQKLSELQAKVSAGQSLVYQTAWEVAKGIDRVKEVSMVKAYCGELVNEVMYVCQQFHGGFGYIRESAIERMVRDARIQSIGGGATEVMLEEVAKRMG